VATSEAIRAELSALAESRAREMHSTLRRRHPDKDGFCVTREVPRNRIIDIIIEGAGDPSIQSELAVLVGLPSEVDEAIRVARRAAWPAWMHVGLTCVAVLVAVGSWLFPDALRWPSQNPIGAIDRALAESRPCGMTDAESLRMIANVSETRLSRQQELELFDQTFKPGDTHRQDCEPCLQAVLDAAGVDE